MLSEVSIPTILRFLLLGMSFEGSSLTALAFSLPTTPASSSTAGKAKLPLPESPRQLAPYATCRPLRDFFLQRNVTARAVSWLGRGGEMLPLQIYRGSSVGPKQRARRVSLQQSRETPANLSQSAQSLIQKYDKMSEKERDQLENKIQAEARASEPLNPSTDLHIIYLDDHICVTSKPSGILSVPGPRRNPSLAGLVYEALQPAIDIDHMIVHRLDMDTSGILVYALTQEALRQLHIDFRDRRVQKTYEALLTGHLLSTVEVEIDVALERDPFHPPFMRAAQSTGKAESERIRAVHPTFRKFIDQAPKPSQTELRVLSLEYLSTGQPVTRVRLTPTTGRTHQLRVHCASLGFPIVGDDIYGFKGAGDCGIVFDDPEAADRLRVQQSIYEQSRTLCLHAKQLCFHHPRTRSPLIFEAATPF